MKNLVLCAALAAASTTGLAAAPEQKLVGTEWVWFTDYAYLTSEWTLNAEEGCSLQVGTGMKIGGTPRGQVRTFAGHVKFTTWGIGAVHVRAIGGMAPCTVRIDQGSVQALGVYSDPSLIRGLIRDGRIVYDALIK